MTKPTAEELRRLPKKDAWSDAEALTLYETTPDGWELCCGAPLPFYVETREDRVRWAHCARIATQVTGEQPTGQLAGQLARTMFTDRGQYTPLRSAHSSRPPMRRGTVSEQAGSRRRELRLNRRYIRRESPVDPDQGGKLYELAHPLIEACGRWRSRKSPLAPWPVRWWSPGWWPSFTSLGPQWQPGDQRRAGDPR